MPTGQAVETRGHVVGFQEEIQIAAAQGKDPFFTWFDSAADTEAAFVRGTWDFLIHVAMPAARYLACPEEKTVLEIGHGGGRILAAACRSFRKGIGIDVHDNNALVEGELRARGVANCRLVKTDGRCIPVGDCTVDLVYSFIVLQHVERIDVFKSYFAETHRVLKPGALAVLYFGRKRRFSLNKRSRLLYWADRLLEELSLRRRGYQEIPARVNETNLVVAMSFAKRLSRSLRFEILKTLVSRKRVPDGMDLFGGQHGLLLRKP